MNSKRDAEQIESRIEVLRSLLADEYRKMLDLQIRDELARIIREHNSEQEKKENVERFPIDWYRSPDDLPESLGGIFFLCDLHNGRTVFIGETSEPRKYLMNPERRKNKYDEICLLELPYDYWNRTPPVHSIGKGAFQRLLHPKDNRRYSWR